MVVEIINVVHALTAMIVCDNALLYLFAIDHRKKDDGMYILLECIAAINKYI